jgi:PAS domain S-box-containing protein
VGDESRDATIARLRADVETLRTLLREHLVQREMVEEELRENLARYRRLADALRVSEERYRSLFRRAAHGIYVAQPDGRLIDVNPALVAMLGYASADELLGMNLPADVFHDRAQYDALLARLGAGGPSDRVDVRWKMKDGTPLTARLGLRVVHDAEGRLEAYEGIAEDVTERLRRDELLRRSERMASLGSTIAGVAHELNNPLAAIGGFAQLMLRESNVSEEDRHALQTIHHECNRAAKIVRDLLTFARRQEAQEREPVDLNDVIGYLMATQRYAMETHGIERELRLGSSLPPVLAERTQMEQVVLNLVVNARQALEAMVDAPTHAGTVPAPRAARIGVRTWAEGGRLMMEVSDNGPGIPPEIRSRIWDPFFTTKPEGEGTGLGLAVVHGIVSSYDGTIDVESEVGVGTRFTVSFPAHAPETVGAPSVPDVAPPRRPTQASRPLDILLVEDEASIRRVVSRYFSARGHAVVVARDGAEGVKLARQSRFDVVICDLRLPELDGYEVVRRIKALPEGVRTRCIIVTGGGPDLLDPLRADPMMVAAVLAKPYDIEELRAVVEA